MSDNDKKDVLSKKIDKLSFILERMNFNEYFAYLKDKKRMLFINFTAGLARGFGMAIGFTLLGALTIYILEQVALQNLPVIGNFIAEIIKLVKNHL